VLLVALWTALVHAGAAEGKLLAQRIIAESWPELVSACRLGLTLQPHPEWHTPPDGAPRARRLNGVKFYISRHRRPIRYGTVVRSCFAAMEHTCATRSARDGEAARSPRCSSKAVQFYPRAHQLLAHRALLRRPAPSDVAACDFGPCRRASSSFGIELI
jgi:hypothetical protein